MRGFTVAAMILVNDPGDWDHVWPVLLHAPWDGCRPPDLIFPFFLFLMGCVIPFSFDRRLAAGESRLQLAGHVLWRVAALIGLKLLLSAYPKFHLEHLRLFGVLTRIAFCYLGAALLYLVTQRRGVLFAVSTIALLLYWVLLCAIPVPGLGMPGQDFPLFDPTANLGAWLDRAFSGFTRAWLHTGVLYEKTWDPEGLLGTLPSLVTTLMGILAGKCFRDAALTPTRRPYVLLCWGVVCVLVGLLWNNVFPINKSLWSSSFVLFTGGCALLLLAAFDILFDLRRVQDRSRIAALCLTFFRVFGMNAIFAFLFSAFVVKTLAVVPWPDGRGHNVLRTFYAGLAALTGPRPVASFLFACLFVGAMFVPLYAMYRRRIILKL